MPGMRNLGVFASAVIGIGAVALSACSGSVPDRGSALPASTAGAHSAAGSAHSGLARVPALAQVHAGQLRGVRHRKAGLKQLYVDDFITDSIAIFDNDGWTNAGSIGDPSAGPDGNWVDQAGNLYVANYRARNITEYAPGATAPTFTYASGMNDPVGVTTDEAGNVYEADFDGGFVNEYSQATDAVVASCSPGGTVEGVAVDENGNVFADYFDGSQGRIIEYFGGLSGCAGLVLGVTLQYPGGMVADKNGGLIVCDQVAANVDIIKPPYGSITTKLGTGWLEPFHVTISRAKKQAYVTDAGLAAVVVLTFPRGNTIATLSAANGLALPSSAVDSKNFIP